MRAQRLRRLLLAKAVFAPMLACTPTPPLIPTSEPTSAETTASYEALRNLPAPTKPVPVAVYSYPDLTGQLKPSETITNNSRAVTQGAVWMLVKSLKDAGGGRWFKVIQRANLENLLKERQIIRETRGRVQQQTGQAQPQLPSLLFAGIILEGGIIGYDSNTVTGGIGARYLGIGGDVQYRQDTVTVYLNAISSQNGEILKSVMARKTVASYGVRGSVFKFVAFQKLLEGETGYTVNEPGQIAVAQAIEHAVRALIIEGALESLWQFEDEIAGREETQLYLDDKEADLLLGDAGTAVAQSLLTEGQLKTLTAMREARRERLKAQSERRELRAFVERTAPASPETIPVPPPNSISAPTGSMGPTPRVAVTNSAEKLVDSLKQQETASLQQMIKTVASPTPAERVKDAEPRPPALAKPLPQPEPEAEPLNISALYGLLAEFTAETWLLMQDGDQRFDHDDRKPRPVTPHLSADRVFEAALIKRPSDTKGAIAGTGGQEL